MSFDQSLSKRSINIKSVGNARELGGYESLSGRKIRRGILLRTAAINTISESDKDILCKEYHLAVVVDFRSSYESRGKEDPTLPGVKNCVFSIIDEEQMKAMEKEFGRKDFSSRDPGEKVKFLEMGIEQGFIGENMYIEFLKEESGIKGYRAFFRELIDLPQGRSILFHCTQGKDRTGLGAMLIMSALGVSEENIVDDYMLTNIFNEKLIENERMFFESMGIRGERLVEYMRAMDEVNPQTMENALLWVKREYGSVKGYINRALGISDEELEGLKRKFLE
ncbi:MAG: tyrosine-protein phosphatase [Lachnospiraceae bacterium]|nr:tyrosine-protein phosphatase [Lachnospiraceae bacterium]